MMDLIFLDVKQRDAIFKVRIIKVMKHKNHKESDLQCISVLISEIICESFIRFSLQY